MKFPLVLDNLSQHKGVFFVDTTDTSKKDDYVVDDVEFEDNELPFIRDALEVDNHGKRCVMEVAQHIGNHVVRCILLASGEGLQKDMEVIATGSGIEVPVGEKTLGLSLIHI